MAGLIDTRPTQHGTQSGCLRCRASAELWLWGKFWHLSNLYTYYLSIYLSNYPSTHLCILYIHSVTYHLLSIYICVLHTFKCKCIIHLYSSNTNHTYNGDIFRSLECYRVILKWTAYKKSYRRESCQCLDNRPERNANSICYPRFLMLWTELNLTTPFFPQLKYATYELIARTFKLKLVTFKLKHIYQSRKNKTASHSS